MKQLPIIRRYELGDIDDLVALLRLNTPKYFAPKEESDFIFYLHHETESYFLLEINRQIVGCGGINYSLNKSIAILSWDIIHPHFHGKSFGSMLLQHRLQEIKSIGEIHKIMVRTTQLTFGFYQRHGFTLLRVVKDYWAIGFDLYEMELAI